MQRELISSSKVEINYGECRKKHPFVNIKKKLDNPNLYCNTSYYGW